MKINVVNKRAHKTTVHDFYVGRPSLLGNNYTHESTKKTLAKYVVPTREEAIEKYEQDFKVAVLKDKKVKKEIEKIYHHLKTHKVVNLVCWCSPRPCHADVIKAHLISMISRDDSGNNG